MFGEKCIPKGVNNRTIRRPLYIQRTQLKNKNICVLWYNSSETGFNLITLIHVRLKINYSLSENNF